MRTNKYEIFSHLFQKLASNCATLDFKYIGNKFLLIRPGQYL